MGAYAQHEIAEAQRWQQHDAQVSKDEWIRDRADELQAKWPEELTRLYNPFLLTSLPGLRSEAAQDAYAEMVDKICLAQAVEDWQNKEWLGKDWTP